MRISRLLVPLLLTAALTAPPAEGASVNPFTAWLHVNCFGCDGYVSPANGDATFLLHGPASFYGQVTGLPGALCRVSWTLVYGYMYGSRVLDFRLDVVGGVFLFSGQDPVGEIYTGAGVLLAPGLACGTPADFQMVGAFASKGG